MHMGATIRAQFGWPDDALDVAAVGDSPVFVMPADVKKVAP
jgi:hypothetical protein